MLSTGDVRLRNCPKKKKGVRKMGLSASQARLLNLTARMHDIEYKAQNLEAQKLQMANESTQVYQEYENALNRQKVQFKQIGADGSANYVDASVTTLLQNGYQIKILSGNDWYDYNSINNPTAQKTNTQAQWQTYESEITEVNLQTAIGKDGKKAGETVTDNGVTYKLAEPAAAGVTTVKGYKQKTADPDVQAKLVKIDFTKPEVLRNLVEAGFIVFEKPNSDGTFAQVNIATDTSLQEVSDETQLKKAEAKYEADMRKINAKDKKFDTDLAAMEQERNAIKTEIDTLKSVAKDNVDRTFKLFS